MKVEEQRIEEPREGVSLGEFLEVLHRHARLIAFVTLGCMLASVTWLAFKPPVYRATATLLLDDGGQAGGVLGELALLTSSPTAVSEIEILSSRTIASETVEPSRAGVVPAPGATDLGRHLGLRTVVDDEQLAPLPALFADAPLDVDAPRARLFANLEWVDRARAEQRLRVEFLSADRVRIGVRGPLGLRWAAAWLGPDPIVVDYVPRAPIEYEGMQLSLLADGDLTGRSFLVARLSKLDSVERVMAGTRANETRRNSGVIKLVYEDTDPDRAAETANALCLNYLSHNHDRSERRASQTVGFIEEQLESQLDLLNAAEQEVVHFQVENPTSIDVNKTAAALIERISALEVQRIETKLMQVTLREALELLDAGDVQSLSQLGAELADPISLSYIQEIALLSAESEVLERDDSGAYKNLVQTKLLELEATAQLLTMAVGDLERTVAALEAGDADAYGRLTGPDSVAADPLAQGYVEELAELRAREGALLSDFTEEHPDVISVRAGQADVRGRILGLLRSRLDGSRERQGEQLQLLSDYQARIDGMPKLERGRIDLALASLQRKTFDHLGSRLQGLDRARQSLEGEIAGLESELGQLPEEQRMVADPMRRLEAHTEIVKFLLGRQQEAEITRAASTASADFIDMAVAPRERHGPSVPIYVLGGLLIGLLVGIGFSFAVESLDRGVFTASELEQATGLAVFGSIPDFTRGKTRFKGDRKRFLALRDDPEGPIAEAYRAVRTNLKFHIGQGTDVRTFGVTSSTQGEGKSITNIDLSLAFAQSGQRVLLVDADMRRPTLDGHFSLPRTPGLSEILTEGRAWTDCLHESVMENLDVITAGRQPSRPSDVLGSKESQAFVDDIRARYDLVVFDVPPVLAVSDIGSFASKLDAMVLLCRSEKLRSRVLSGSTLRLRQAGANLIGAVLNAARPQRRDDTYGYGYGYGYGYSSKDAA